jgi:glycosyltransferase involved in cell wall biosynthesis
METNTPTVVMSESTAWDERRAGWKEWIKSRLVKLNSAGLAGGTPHADYLAQLGLTPDRIFKGYDIVDNGYFSAKAEEARSQKSEVRSQKSLPEKYFLASARFVEKKNLRRLIEAYARYREMAQKAEGGSQESEVRSQRSEVGSQEAEDGNRKAEVWKLVLLGDGPLKSDLCRLISDLGLQDSVLLPGFKQYDELPAYFGLAGAFVHASTTEQWGLVVNEAMASGLPVLVSSRCGCAADLVQEGVNGFQFDPGNVEELAGLMLKISAFSFQLSTFGSESRRIIAGWGPERFAGGLSDAVAAALKNPRPRAGLVDRLLLRLLLRR